MRTEWASSSGLPTLTWNLSSLREERPLDQGLQPPSQSQQRQKDNFWGLRWSRLQPHKPGLQPGGWRHPQRIKTPYSAVGGGGHEAPPLIRPGRYRTRAGCYQLLAYSHWTKMCYCWQIPVTASLQVMPRLTRESHLIKNQDNCSKQWKWIDSWPSHLLPTPWMRMAQAQARAVQLPRRPRRTTAMSG
jgi:hypothetical protein